MRIGIVYVICTVAGCGFRVGAGTPGPDDGRIDGPGDVAGDAPDGDGATDAPTDAPIIQGNMCMMKWANHTVMLSAPVPLVAQNTTGNDRDPFLTKDGLKLYFDSDIVAAADIYVASRATAVGPFGTATAVSELNSSSAVDGKVSLMDDGKLAVFASDRTNSSGDVDLWIATRSAVTNPFSAITRAMFLPSIDDFGPQQDPDVTGDGKHVYFAEGGTTQWIVEISRGDAASDFGSPSIVINSGFGDADPALSADQKLILFTSSRSGGSGATDIWYATRGAAGDSFGTAEVVPTINSSSFDGDAALSQDGCTVYFSSSRTSSQFDLFSSVVL